MTAVEWTHPDVFTRGIEEGWADPETDPTRIDWPNRQAAAAIPFTVMGGRPVRPGPSTGVRRGRGEMGHWGEAQAADAAMLAEWDGRRWLLMIQRGDGHGWALPGGHVDPGEAAWAAAVRELEEETGLVVPPGAVMTVGQPRLVDDPRGTDEAWMVTTPVTVRLGQVASLPQVAGGDDAKQAVWLPAGSLRELVVALPGGVFEAHRPLLLEVLGR